MIRKIAALLLLFATVAGPLGALDLTPHQVVLANDGPPMKRYFFEDGGKRVSFRIDSKMAISGGGDSVAFRFDDIKSAAMKISRSQMKAALPFESKNLEFYRSVAQTVLAPNAS